jgi:hypothetical protein
VQTEVVEVQTKTVLEDVVQTKSVEMQIEVVLDEILALGLAVGGLLKVMQRKQGA